MPKNRIIYSKRIMTKLVEAGYIPKGTMPNPTKQDFLCWIFEITPGFQEALDKFIEEGNEE